MLLLTLETDFSAFGKNKFLRVRANKTMHISQLKPRTTTEVHIDAAIRGLGTGACGPDVLEEFRLSPGPYEMVWSFEVLTQNF